MGSGTLVTFPVLLAFGLGPVTANVSNTIGLVPGSAAGALGYRTELRGQGRRTRILALASIGGALAGAALLLSLPGSAFKAIVPVFIAAALLLVVVQPRLARYLAARRERLGREQRGSGPMVIAAVAFSGIYGGYFGAAQGILLLGILGLSSDEALGRINAIKVVLAGLVNLTSGIVFALAAHVDWRAAGLIAGGSIAGGWLGARWGRRLSPDALRILIVVVGVAAIVRLL